MRRGSGGRRSKTGAVGKATASRKAVHEFSAAQWLELWSERHRDANEVLATLERKIAESESPSERVAKLKDFEGELTELPQNAWVLEEEVRIRRDRPPSERGQLRQLEREAGEEKERIRTLERDLYARQLG
jgi:hypothetical protein